MSKKRKILHYTVYSTLLLALLTWLTIAAVPGWTIWSLFITEDGWYKLDGDHIKNDSISSSELGLYSVDTSELTIVVPNKHLCWIVRTATYVGPN